MLGGGYPTGGYGGVGYGLSPIAPRGPWTPAMVGVGGSFLPYGSSAPVYPSHINGGPAVNYTAGNGYNGILASGFGGKSTQMNRENSKNAAESTASRNGTDTIDANSFGSNKQSQKGNDKPYQATNSI